MEILLVAVVAALIAYFVLLRGKGAGSTAAPEQPRKSLPGKAPPEPRGARKEGAPERSSKLPKRREEADGAAPADGSEPEEASDGAEAAPAPAAARGPDVSTLRRGLARSRDSGGLFGKLKSLFGQERTIDESLVEEIEEVLLTSDVGVGTTQAILERLKGRLKDGSLADGAAVWSALREEARSMLELGGTAGLQPKGRPTVALFVGVNGSGKTTTIGKLATQLKSEGRSCVLAAGDTFRAAAVQQLKIWGQRVGCEVVHGKDGADPGSVVFEAVKKAQELGADFVLADTAGRLHTKSNLMIEMQKIARSAGKALNGAPQEIFLVLDSTNGQNAVAQAKEFKEALDLTGIVLTKLDGTAKGGVVLGITDSLRVPVRFVGLGEGPEDLHEFHSARFVDALLGEERVS